MLEKGNLRLRKIIIKDKRFNLKFLSFIKVKYFNKEIKDYYVCNKGKT